MPEKERETKLPAPSISPALAGLATSLEEAMHATEPDFLSLGEALTAIYGDAAGLAKRMVASVEESGDAGLAGRISDAITTSLSAFRQHKRAIEENLTTLSAGASEMNSLLSVSGRIRSSTRFLSIAGFNLRLEGRRTAETMALFSGFGEETQALARKIGEILERILATSETARGDQAAAHGELTARMANFQRLSDAAEQAVALAAREVGPLMESARFAMTEAQRYSGDISHQAGAIVTSIQFHDIARQQVEHIASGLADAAAMMSDLSEDAPEKIGAAHFLLKLQAAHLEEVIEGIGKAHGNLLSAFENIGGGVTNLSETLSSSGGEAAADSGMAAQFTAIGEGLENLMALAGKQAEMAARMRETMKNAHGAVSNLSEFAEQVSLFNGQLKLIALNAIIMTGKLVGRGAAMEVLAMEVRNISNESSLHVAEFLTILSSITALAAGTEEGSAVACGDAVDTAHEDYREEICAALEAENLRITGVIEKHRESGDAAARGAEALAAAIGRVRADLAFLPRLVEQLKENRTTLTQMETALSPWAATQEMGASPRMKEIARRYTMESERHLHRRILDNDAPTAAPPQENAGPAQAAAKGQGHPHGEGEEEAFGDNIELF